MSNDILLNVNNMMDYITLNRVWKMIIFYEKKLICFYHWVIFFIFESFEWTGPNNKSRLICTNLTFQTLQKIVYPLEK